MVLAGVRVTTAAIDISKTVVGAGGLVVVIVKLSEERRPLEVADRLPGPA